jgi:chaperonin GroES
MIKPLGKNIAIKILKENDTSVGGIFIGKAPEDMPAEAIVIAVGSGILNKQGKRIPLSIEIGEHILIAKYGVNKKIVDGQDIGFITEDAILGTMLDFGNIFKPFGDHVIVKNIKETDMSPGGIIVSLRKTNALHVWADVVDIGDKCNFVKVDYSIYFPRLLAWQLEGDRMLIKEETVLCAEDNS